MNKAKQKNILRKAQVHTVPSNAIDSSRPISVTLSPPTGLARWKPFFDLLSVLGLFLSILVLGISTRLSWLQFCHARQQAQAAEQALLMAEHAQLLSQNAEQQISKYTNLVEKIKNELMQTKALTDLSYLTIRAETGDRAALSQLKTLSVDGDGWVTTTAEKNLNRIFDRYEGMQISDPLVASRMQGFHMMGVGDSNSVERFLGSPQYETRAEAVDTVRFLRLNYLIPRLIDLGVAEQDLHVVQVICNGLNELLLTPNSEWELQEQGASVKQPLSVSDFVMSTEATRIRLLQIWEKRRERLLSVKPKYWQQAGSGFNLIDPETRGIKRP